MRSPAPRAPTRERLDPRAQGADEQRPRPRPRSARAAAAQLCRPARTSPIATTPRTATAASPHAPNPIPSAATPPASTSANGTTPAGPARSQRGCSDDERAQREDHAQRDDLLDRRHQLIPVHERGHGRGQRRQQRPIRPRGPMRRASTHAGPAAVASMNALNGCIIQIRGSPEDERAAAEQRVRARGVAGGVVGMDVLAVGAAQVQVRVAPGRGASGSRRRACETPSRSRIPNEENDGRPASRTGASATT